MLQFGEGSDGTAADEHGECSRLGSRCRCAGEIGEAWNLPVPVMPVDVLGLGRLEVL